MTGWPAVHFAHEITGRAAVSLVDDGISGMRAVCVMCAMARFNYPFINLDGKWDRR